MCNVFILLIRHTREKKKPHESTKNVEETFPFCIYVHTNSNYTLWCCCWCWCCCCQCYCMPTCFLINWMSGPIRFTHEIYSVSLRLLSNLKSQITPVLSHALFTTSLVRTRTRSHSTHAHTQTLWDEDMRTGTGLTLIETIHFGCQRLFGTQIF